MLRYLLSRLLYMLPVVWLVVSVVFLLIHLVPGDPIQQMLGEGAAATDIDAARHAYGLDVPLGQQYVNYWRGILHGDMGRSLRLNQNVGQVIAKAYPATLQLTICRAGGGSWVGDSRRRALGAAPQSLGRSRAKLCLAAGIVVPQFRSGTDPHTRLCD